MDILAIRGKTVSAVICQLLWRELRKENWKLNVAINFQFLFLDEELINRSRSKWQKYQEGRTQVQKCPGGVGREEGKGLSLCFFRIMYIY